MISFSVRSTRAASYKMPQKRERVASIAAETPVRSSRARSTSTDDTGDIEYEATPGNIDDTINAEPNTTEIDAVSIDAASSVAPAATPIVRTPSRISDSMMLQIVRSGDDSSDNFMVFVHKNLFRKESGWADDFFRGSIQAKRAKDSRSVATISMNDEKEQDMKDVVDWLYNGKLEGLAAGGETQRIIGLYNCALRLEMPNFQDYLMDVMQDCLKSDHLQCDSQSVLETAMKHFRHYGEVSALTRLYMLHTGYLVGTGKCDMLELRNDKPRLVAKFFRQTDLAEKVMCYAVSHDGPNGDPLQWCDCSFHVHEKDVECPTTKASGGQRTSRREIDNYGFWA